MPRRPDFFILGAPKCGTTALSEYLRRHERVFVSTPNAWFPVDPHTLLPFVHWLPRRIRHPILRATGNGRGDRRPSLGQSSVPPRSATG